MYMALRNLVLAAASTVALAGACIPVAAHETDQYTLPLDQRLADMGDYFDAVHYRALDRAVTKLNAQIADAMRETDPEKRRDRLDRLHEPWQIAEAVHAAFNDAFFEVLDVELALRSDWAQNLKPGELTAHYTLDWIYTFAHFPADPRRVVLMFQSSTVRAYGVYFGTDKLSHFHHLGIMYYETLLRSRALGLSEEESLARVRSRFVEGPISEWALLGFVATGVHSNADLAANYAGMKFYQNLTEAVVLKGELHPPLVVIKDEMYRMNLHVRPESGWFGVFVSDHWNEALNPNLYDPGLRSRVQGVLRQRAEQIVEFYTRVDGRPADPAYFDRYAHELSTLGGEDYGHCRQWEDLMTIGGTCWPVYVQKQHERQGPAFASIARVRPIERERVVSMVGRVGSPENPAPAPYRGNRVVGE
jgi:hypothetical protein